MIRLTKQPPTVECLKKTALNTSKEVDSKEYSLEEYRWQDWRLSVFRFLLSEFLWYISTGYKVANNIKWNWYTTGQVGLPIWKGDKFRINNGGQSPSQFSKFTCVANGIEAGIKRPTKSRLVTTDHALGKCKGALRESPEQLKMWTNELGEQRAWRTAMQGKAENATIQENDWKIFSIAKNGSSRSASLESSRRTVH